MKNHKLGYKLKELRRSRNLSQNDLSKKCNFSIRTISRYENGENISVQFLHLFSKKLKLNPNEHEEIFKLYFDKSINFEELKYLFEKIYNILGYTFDENSNIIYNKTKKYELNYQFIDKNLNFFIEFLNNYIHHEITEFEINNND